MQTEQQPLGDQLDALIEHITRKQQARADRHDAIARDNAETLLEMALIRLEAMGIHEIKNKEGT